MAAPAAIRTLAFLGVVAAPLRAGALRIAFGSCNKQERDQGYWQLITARSPDVWVWGGDNVYADQRGILGAPTRVGPHFEGHSCVEGQTCQCIAGVVCFSSATPGHLREVYAQQAAMPGYQALVSTVSKVLGTWDDHDMGLNDGDGRFKYRAESMQELLDFLGEPKDSPRRRQAGVWGSWLSPGRKGSRVAVHLLDARYSRKPYGDPDGDFFAEDQWSWLESSLREARDDAAVNIVVSSLQVLRSPATHGESWGRFPKARARLLQMLAASGNRGIVLLSGDVHMAQLSAIRCGGTVLHEVTSSGLTHSISDMWWPIRWLARLVLWVYPHNHLVYPTWYGRNWGELDIDLDDPLAPRVTARILSLDPRRRTGEPVIEHELGGLSDGTPFDNADCQPWLGREAEGAFWARLVASAAAGVASLLLAAWFALHAARRRWAGREAPRAQEPRGTGKPHAD